MNSSLIILGYVTIALWALFVFLTIKRPQHYTNSFVLMTALFFTLLFIAGNFGENMIYALITMSVLVFLALLVVPVMLVINGLEVLKKESFSIPHLLSLILGIGIGAGEIAMLFSILGGFDHGFMGNLNRYAFFFGLTVLYFSCLLLNFVVYCVFIQIMPHFYNFNYIIIHGCGLIDGERVTRLLANRCDKAIKVYKRCRKKAKIIASGGQGSDEKISEAQAIKNYLLEQGVEEENILLEDQSATTMENLINSKKIIDERGDGKRVALVSSNYHIYRCLSYARKIDMDCRGIGAKTALYYWPTALIREFVAVFLKPSFILFALSGYGLFIGLMAAIFIGI